MSPLPSDGTWSQPCWQCGYSTDGPGPWCDVPWAWTGAPCPRQLEAAWREYYDAGEMGACKIIEDYAWSRFGIEFYPE